ncbi:MAG TPA: hypothetical protein VMG08_18050 [Allosphingosinicella sp.]|nr:hypothetical protein [Allosphingosinicella sp.]
MGDFDKGQGSGGQDQGGFDKQQQQDDGGKFDKGQDQGGDDYADKPGFDKQQQQQDDGGKPQQ